MASTKQIEANRKNALKSTGPRTNKGKAVTKFNAVTHGLQAKHVVLPEEDPDEFERLLDELIQEIEPRGAREYRLVENIAVGMWRLRRVYRVEVGMFMLQQYEIAIERAKNEASRYVKNIFSSRKTDVVIDEIKHDQAMAKVKRVTNLKKDELPTLAQAFVQGSLGADGFGKLSRYETSIERSMYGAWDKLQRLQEARKTDDAVKTVLTIDGTPANDPEPSAGGA